MIQFLINHPAVFLFLLPALPSILGKIEKAAIAQLLARGDSVDQKLLRTVAKAIVVWAEEKGSINGAAKFTMADKLISRALPFLTAEQRKELIESAVAELDKSANDALH